MSKALPEVITIRVPKGTVERARPHLAGESFGALWRRIMLEWLAAAEQREGVGG